MDPLRHGGTDRLFGGVRAPSPLGTLLRTFTWPCPLARRGRRRDGRRAGPGQPTAGRRRLGRLHQCPPHTTHRSHANTTSGHRPHQPTLPRPCALVLAAIAHANGSHEHSGVDFNEDGTPPEDSPAGPRFIPGQRPTEQTRSPTILHGCVLSWRIGELAGHRAAGSN